MEVHLYEIHKIAQVKGEKAIPKKLSPEEELAIYNFMRQHIKAG